MKRTIEIGLGERSYPIHVGRGILGDPSSLAPHVAGRQVFVISDENVADLYLHSLERALEGSRGVDSHIIRSGERSKTLEELTSILQALAACRLGRDGVVVALGGGVVGDIAGFAAATYQRGVDFVQIPTTLLAQVDSSVGGKTGVNLPVGKNLVGAFHQPRCVVIDTKTLATLAPREMRAGFAEVVKYGLIGDADFFVWLEGNVDALLALDDQAIAHAVIRSCEEKAKAVMADEREIGQRALLNLGHTFGHAIEAGAGYGRWLHGEAVAVGIILAARLSEREGGLEAMDCRRIEALFEKANLPLHLPTNLSPERMLELMSLDKKNREGKMRLILLRRIGEAVVSADFDPSSLRKTLVAAAAAARDPDF
ncbi:3-dehydroquinate synthase [Thioalkalivibrio sp. HK1]|uniref:3-dehydroquinate synthase n=1 Tax=Thioalkalivibrio sp. HK1 TaxID=1469245 RepID=UPI000470E75E|nr:3-dehydroquinate synthase [Thioalkalivibrio sp. HK1]